MVAENQAVALAVVPERRGLPTNEFSVVSVQNEDGIQRMLQRIGCEESASVGIAFIG